MMKFAPGLAGVVASFLTLTLLPCCGPSRTLIHTGAPAKPFDNDVRAHWSLGMSRDEVKEAAERIKLRLTTTEDARALREVDPSYQSGQAIVARITRPGINIDAPYFEARRQIGYLYFLFGDADRLRTVTYRLSDEQEEQAHTQFRRIVPEEDAQ